MTFRDGFEALASEAKAAWRCTGDALGRVGTTQVNFGERPREY